MTRSFNDIIESFHSRIDGGGKLDIRWVAELKKELVERALEESLGNTHAAAAMLGLNQSTLFMMYTNKNPKTLVSWEQSGDWLHSRRRKDS